MYKKNSNSIIVFVCLVLSWSITIPSFAIDFSSSLKQSSKDVTTAASLFVGKSGVGNLYEKALKAVKQNETAATDLAVQAIVSYFAQQSCVIEPQDVLQVLYVSHPPFSTFFDHVVLSSLTSPRLLPTQADIDRSYSKFFACYRQKNGPSKVQSSDYVTVQQDLLSLYHQSLNSSFPLSTLAQDHVGEDIFWNGSIDDSFYDLLVDINKIGELFFQEFKQAPQTYSYKLPTFGAPASNPGGASSGPSGSTPSSSSDPGQGKNTQTQQTASGGSVGSWSRGDGVMPSPAPLGSETVSSLLSSPATISQDTDVQQFLTVNNPSSFVQPSYPVFVGTICSPNQVLPASQSAEQEADLDVKKSLAEVIDFIRHANGDKKSQEILLSGFLSAYQAITKKNPADQSTTTAEQIKTISTTYGNALFGDATLISSSCTSNCGSLTGDAYTKCHVGCTKSCIQSCETLPWDDKILCVVNCTCKMISAPQGAGWDKIDSMFSIKFCQQPVKDIVTSPRQVVSSLEGILHAFIDRLQGIKSSGQTIKTKPTKEFLDLGIDLRLSSLLNYTISATFRPIFAQKSDIAEQRKKIQENKPLVSDLLDMAADADVDDYNKYVLISDIPKNKAQQQPLASQASAEESFSTLEEAKSASSAPSLALFQQQKSAMMAEQIQGLLDTHIAFWDHFFNVSVDILQNAHQLKSKIEASE